MMIEENIGAASRGINMVKVDLDSSFYHHDTSSMSWCSTVMLWLKGADLDREIHRQSG